MKKTTYITFVFWSKLMLICLLSYIILGGLTACSSDSSSSQTVSNTDNTTIETASASTEEKVPSTDKSEAENSSKIDASTGEPVKKLAKANKPTDSANQRIEKQKKISPFADLGCCKDNLGKAQPCCCDKIVSVYNDFLKGNEKILAEVKLKDPFFEDCSTKVEFLKKIEGLEDLFYGDDDED